ncbi:colorectal mutant cancer protein isoform X2 [Coccinella septempunctata]|uniref:colorectal mutant cancer protein isoform X2 n=1 Tax=Coccinella septempunctata TaxID=41139 RepID=UPI001D099428|nr:colorectal mutant cancer protein isoform X2 [Coccinella septempunctata]
MADTDCASESTSSICDEERIKRLFQACDANGDGYIDSQDLAAICRELSLEDSLDELMLQLGADSQGRITYEQFLKRRLALRPEIDALKVSNKDNISELSQSQGKLDKWEWDSGARDMSPVHKSRLRNIDIMENELVKERLQQQLDEQAQRYEEQLTELHSVIAELTRKLHHQRTLAIAEEDEISETCTSVHDESVTCPLEVSELEPLEPDSSDLDNRIHLADSPSELPEPKLNSSNNEQNESTPSPDVEPLKQEINRLKCQLQDAQYKLAQYAIAKDEIIEEMTNASKNLDSPESHIEVDCKSFQESSPRIDIKFSNIVPIHKNKQNSTVSTPVSKVAERVKLKRSANGIKDPNSSEVANSELTTAVAEHIVGDILRHCDTQNEKTAVDIELRQLYTKLEHARAQNNVLVLTLSETKAHCDRLALLCGKYESNAVALRLALGVTDRAIEAYDVLLALLETELALNEGNAESIQNRSAAETVAKQLLSYLDSYEVSSDMLLSPWQNHVYDGSKMDNELWTSDHETRLREHVSRLKAERSNIQGTFVALESTYVENIPAKPMNNQESRKMDLEMAVLLQELMGLREEKSELVSKIFALEKDKSAMQLKLKYVEGQQRAQSATLKNLQGQLKDTEALLALASQNRERGYSDAEHAQGVEFELMQALAREARLKVRLQELVSTLEQVTKNAEARLLEGREIVHDLNQTNSVLAETVDRNNKRYQAKFKKMEQQMLTMVEKHTAQVHTLQQRIASMETPPTNSSDNSLASLAV